MVNKPYLSVIIPVYNEADLLPSTLIDVDRYLRKANFEYELLILNDGSKDNTVEIIRNFEPIIQKMRFINNDIHRGRGYVIRQGLKEAEGIFRLLMDADNSINIDHFSQMIPYLEGTTGKKYDIITGSRGLKESKLIPLPSFYNRVLSNIGKTFVRILLLPNVRDTRCGFKCFSENIAKRISSIMKINRSAVDIEILAISNKMGYEIKEIPVTWINTHETVKLFTYCNLLQDLIKIRIWLWMGRYKFDK